MLHIVAGASSDTGHHHETVAQARDCEEAHAMQDYFEQEEAAERRAELHQERVLESPDFYSALGRDTREEDAERYWESLRQEEPLHSAAV